MTSQSNSYKSATSSLVKAAVFGAVAGAAAMALSDKKKRKALMDAVVDLKEKGKKQLDTVEKRVNLETKNVQKKLSKNVDQIKKKIN